MASSRTGTGLPAKPSEGLYARRDGTAGVSGGIPRPVNRTARKNSDAGPPAAAVGAAGHTRLPSRVPQVATSRQTNIVPPKQHMPKPSLGHSSTSGGSSSTIASSSSRTRSHTQSGSGSSTSSRSHDNSTSTIPSATRIKKPSAPQTISSHRANQSSGGSFSVPRPKVYTDPALGIRMPHEDARGSQSTQLADAAEIQRGPAEGPTIYPELDRYRDYRRPTHPILEQTFELPFKLSTHDLPPPTPGSILFSGSSSASPSTKFSGSPGPGSYSRDTTPTSASSQSPSISAPMRFLPPKKLSPAITRPPVTRRRNGSLSNVDLGNVDPQGLAAVRESLNSSSSSSTVREGERNIKKEVKPTRKLAPPPPSPPPRKSSQSMRRNLSEDSITLAKTTSRLPQPGTVTSSPKKPSTSSPRPSFSGSPGSLPTPRRPSRDGAPDLHSQLLGPVPVIHSNLSTASLQSERRGSEASANVSMTSLHAYKSASSSQTSINHEPQQSSRAPSSTSRSKNLNVAEPPQQLRTPSPNVATSSRSRFPFFGRKKTKPEGNIKEKQQKEKEKEEKKPAQLRKGPAAGTGHEGYGRIGAIRRRSGSSNLTRGMTDNQTSQESLAGHDTFLSDRMNPVVISGGGIKENRNASTELSRTDSNQTGSSSTERPSTESNVSAEHSSAAKSGTRTTMWPAASPQPDASSESRRPSETSRRPSESSDSDGNGMKSTLAFRRSVQRLRTSPENPMPLPRPINTSGVASSPMTSIDTSVMSDESYLEMQRETSRGRDPAHPAPKKLTKRARSPRKWNLFGRSRNASSSAPKEEERVATPAEPTETEEKKPVPFYAMMDNNSEQDESDIVDIHEVLRNADIYSQPPPELSTPETPWSGFGTPSMPSSNLGTPPQAHPASRSESPARPQPKPRLQITTQQLEQPQVDTLESGRPTRLPRVGRIPKVATSKTEEPSPKSFSRPFRASLYAPRPTSLVGVDPESIAKGPSPPGSTAAIPDVAVEASVGDNDDGVLAQNARTDMPSSGLQTGTEFLRFSPRKNSDGTTATSSGSSMFPLITDATAIIPHPDDPPVEDEVWDEFDDLLGEDHAKSRISTTSSKGIPFYLEIDHAQPVDKPMESPTLVLDSRKASTYSKAPTASSCYSADMTERIRKAFQPHPSPIIPLTVSEEPAQTEEKTSLDNKRLSQSSNKSRESVSTLCSSSSDDESPVAQVNLRVGSMTVSKWLTFGHVLFSDVRHELLPVDGSLKRHSILIIDGLGNDDWSFYAAETYPSATFFNLSPRAPFPTDTKSSPTGFPASPPNHHQIQYVSHMDKFPFAPQSFTSVVFRFPVAAPEAHYRNILSEARRVLKPGGYLELSILDADLNNMGNRGRRTIRRLKERIHQGSPDTALSSTADLIVRLIGKAGFSDIKAARVGVPVASPITKTTRDSVMKEMKKKDHPSLSEMMSDNSATADETITKMVARVGRWWYTKCYENAADDMEMSMWSDKRLLRECEQLGTSFKLMVCCGRAPDRILSV